MQPNQNLIQTGRNLMTICMLGCLLTGCATVGPNAISNGRRDYNEAIARTDNEQLLMSVIHNRYQERGSLLAVASVTANVRISTSTGVELGFGAREDYSGNLTPFRAGAVYEENPTISYVPVQGEKYARQMFSPLSIAVLAQMAGALFNPDNIYTTFVSSVNGISNPDFLFTPDDADPRFERFVAIMTLLTRAQHLFWVEDPKQAGRLSIVIDRYAPTYTAEVRELLELLGLPAPKDPSAQVILQVYNSLDAHETGGIGVVNRSVFDLIQILSAAIEVPEEDQRNGVAEKYPPPGLSGKELRIHRSKSRPQHATVAVEYRDGWFYIDESDQATKQYFRLMATLWAVTIAENTSGAHTSPVLTVPVNR
jgi:hypothetical protein